MEGIVDCHDLLAFKIDVNYWLYPTKFSLSNFLSGME